MLKHASLVLLACLGLSGCGGGGGGNGNASLPDKVVKQNFGNMQAEFAGTGSLKPVIVGSKSAVVTGIAGVNISSLRWTFPPITRLNAVANLPRTFLAYSTINRPYLQPYNGASPVALDPLIGPFSNPCAPAFSPDGRSVYTAEYQPGSAESRIVRRRLDGGGKVFLTSAAKECSSPAVSATKLAYFEYVTNNLSALVVANLDGSGATYILNGMVGPSNLKMSPDGKVLAFTFFNDNKHQLYTVNVDGTGFKVMHGSGLNMGSPLAVQWLPGTNRLLMMRPFGAPTGMIEEYFGPEKQQFAVRQIPSMTGGFSISPDGSRIAYANASTIFSGSLLGGNDSALATTANVSTLAWSPYLQERQLLGTGGAMGTGAAGFLFSQVGSDPKSIVTFDSKIRTGAQIIAQDNPNPTQDAAVVTIKTNGPMTLLRYLPSLFEGLVVVIDANSTATAAIITFDANTGAVASVLPYTGTEAARQAETNGMVVKAKFLGVWSAGKNVRPGGAEEVRLDRRTGLVLSSR